MSHVPSAPPANAPLAVAVNALLLVAALMLVPFPAVPIVRAVIVKMVPDADAQTPVAPALMVSARALVTVAAVSPIKLTCAKAVPPTVTDVVLLHSGAPAKLMVAEAYWFPELTSSYHQSAPA